MKYYKVTVDILVKCESVAEAQDLISESLTGNLQRQGVVEDWQYVQENGRFTEPVEISKQTAENIFYDFNTQENG